MLRSRVSGVSMHADLIPLNSTGDRQMTTSDNERPPIWFVCHGARAHFHLFAPHAGERSTLNLK